MPTEQECLSTGTILIVEDDPTVLEVIRTVLVSAGHKVVTASGGLNALETFQRINSPVLLLLTDVMMPDLTGPALAERLLALDPTLRVLFVSGYYDTQIVQGLVKQFPVLRKPFTPSELLRAIGNILQVSRS